MWTYIPRFRSTEPREGKGKCTELWSLPLSREWNVFESLLQHNNRDWVGVIFNFLGRISYIRRFFYDFPQEKANQKGVHDIEEFASLLLNRKDGRGWMMGWHPSCCTGEMGFLHEPVLKSPNPVSHSGFKLVFHFEERGSEEEHCSTSPLPFWRIYCSCARPSGH